MVGPFSIHHVQNSGIAFGLFAQATGIVILLTLVAVGWMIVYFSRSGARHPLLPVAVGLLIGGSISNLADRVRLGHVTDFLDLRYWPAFNLADSFIVVGRGDPARRPRRRRPQPTPPAWPRPRTSYLRPPAGERLDRFVAALPGVGSRAAAERLLAAGAVLVDGVAAGEEPPAGRRGGGAWSSPGRRPPRLRAPAPDLRIAYEDEHLLVVDKPAGLVVHPAAGHASGTLVQALAGRTAGGDPERPGIVHRLDRDTSGLIVVARTEEAYEGLRALVKRRALEREYLALVRGRPRSRTGRIEAPIGRDRRDPTRRSLDTDAPKDAVTHFEVLELLAGTRAAARPPGDRPHAPDQGAPRRYRAAGRRRSRVRRARARPAPPVPARRPPRLRPSRDGRARRGGLAASARSGGRAGSGTRPLACSPFRSTDPAAHLGGGAGV